jgi:dienelactone hydrolase
MIKSITTAFLLLCLISSPQFLKAADPDEIAFRKHVINPESEFMAACVFDVNKDGKLDIVCGQYWYEAPTWKKHFVRNVETINGRPDGYAHQVLDVNGDGYPDIITVNWRSRSVRWLENPGPDLAKEAEWKTHVIATPGNMETGRLVDILGDGTPCILPSTVAFWWELVKKPNPDGKGFTPDWVQHSLPREIAGHGVGFGDINGDGRGDIVGHAGWLEAPQDRRNGKWIWHPDFELGQTSIPILVVDVDGDGLNDLVWTQGHDYGVYWMKQSRDSSGKITWTRNAIDTSWAGSHAPLWVDIAGTGKPELVVGRRYRAHEGADPGEYDPQCIYHYTYDSKTGTWHRHLISYNDDTCFGLDPVAVDLTGSGRLDLVFGGRHGLYWFENLGKGDPLAMHLTHDPMWFAKYADHNDLMTVKNDAGEEKPVKTLFDAGQRRAQTLAAMQAVTGTLPDSYQRAPLDVKVVAEGKTDTYSRKKITFASDLNSRVTAYLLTPNDLKKGAPAMICLHDDIPAAKDEPVGLSGRASMNYADALAKKGYVCLVPDYPGYGDDHFDFSKNSQAYPSGALKAVWDNIRCIDLLEIIPEVNPKRIGIIGHGLGGQNALLTAALDYRLAATIASCGFTSFKGDKLDKWSDPKMLPRIQTAYHDDPTQIPFDFAELIASLVPRNVMIIAPLHDEKDNVEGVKTAIAGATPIYQLRRTPAALKVLYPDSARDFSTQSQDEAFKFLEQRMTARAGQFRFNAN